MKLKDFKIMGEDEKSYKIGHPSGKTITVDKAGLSKEAHKHIQMLAEGGIAGAPTDPAPSDAPPAIIEEGAPAEQSPAVEGAPAADNVAVAQVTDPNRAPAAVENPGQAAQADAIPAAAAPAPQPTQDPISQSATATGQLLDQEEKDAQKFSKNITAAGAAVNPAIDNATKQIDDLQKQQNQREAEFKAKDDAYQKRIEQSKVDPNRIYKNQSTGSKILAGISMVLGGFGAVAGQPNMAVQMMNDAVNRDVDAQKNDQEKTMNLWKMNRQAYGDDLQANLATRNQILTGVQLQVQKAAASTTNIQAQQNAMQFLHQIQQEKIQNNRLQSIMSVQSSSGPGKGTLIQADPSSLVNQLVKDPKQQEKVFEEIGRAQNIAQNQDKILNAFDQAAKENTLLRTGGGLLRTPGSVMALHQNLLPNFKAIDGTVRQAAMDETFHNVTPTSLDSDHKIQQRRQALVDWMHSETAAPVAKGSGLDLSKFASTAFSPTAEIKTSGGVQYQKVAGGWQKVK